MGALLALFSCGLFSFTSAVQEGYRMPQAVDFSPDAEMIEWLDAHVKREMH